MTPTNLAPVAGYRLLEVIGVGSTAAVYLAEPPGARSGDGDRARDRGSAPVVLKVCRGPSKDDRVAECQTLLDHPVAGMPRLLDATRLPTGEQVIVMTFCAGRSLRARGGGPGLTVRGVAVHGEPPPITWSEAFARLVGDLHEAGHAHGEIDASDVLIDDDGAVFLLGFHASRRRGDPGFEQAAAADRSAVRRLVKTFAGPKSGVSHTPHSGGAGHGPEYPEPGLCPEYPEPGLCPEYPELGPGHGLGYPEPSPGPGSGTDSASHTDVLVPHGSRVVACSGDFAQQFDQQRWAWREREAEAVVAPELSVAAVLEPAYLALVEGSHGLKTLAAAGLRRVVDSRRRKVLLGSAVAVVAVAGALSVAVPAHDAPAVAQAGPAPAHSPSTTPSLSAKPTPTPSAPLAESPAPTARPSPGAGSSSDEAGSAEVVRGDDPVAAATVLLRQRDSCLRSRSSGCLERVDEWSSPALRLDRSAAEGRVAVSAGEPVLVQRIGDTAILTVGVRQEAPAESAVSGEQPAAPDEPTAHPESADAGAGDGTTKPASLLMVRGEAGWRIRSYDPF